jgi:hypothetical protein
MASPPLVDHNSAALDHLLEHGQLGLRGSLAIDEDVLDLVARHAALGVDPVDVVATAVRERLAGRRRPREVAHDPEHDLVLRRGRRPAHQQRERQRERHDEPTGSHESLLS